MKAKKIIVIGLLIISVFSTFAITCSAAIPDIELGPNEFVYNIDETLKGRGECKFDTIKGTVMYQINKGSLVAADSVYGSCWASGDDAKASEIRVKVWATNWLTGEHIYEEENGGLASNGGAYYSVEVECGLWQAVTGTYHEGTIVHNNGTIYKMWVDGYTNN